MNIIIVGAGEIGTHLAAVLSKSEHRITVIERDGSRVRELEQRLDARFIEGEGVSAGVLAEAFIHECELFLAVTSDNAVNLAVSALAKSLGVPQVVSRVHPGLQREEWMFDYRSCFGVDYLFSSERLAAIELSKFIRNPHSMVVEELAQGRIELQQVKVSATSAVVGKSLRDLGAPSRTRVATLTRDDQRIVPTADTKIEVDDCLVIVGEPRRLRELAERLQPSQRRSDEVSVVIFGGGEYGFALAQMLEGWDFRVRIFEKKASRCAVLAEQLTKTTVIHADATSEEELEEEQVGEADFFVSVSESDEDNVMACLQANNLGVRNCFTLIHRSDYAQALSKSGQYFGVVAAISPREATYRELSRFITSEKYHVVKKLGEVLLIHVKVHQDAPADGQKMSDVGWPEGCVVVGRLRGNHAELPEAKDQIQAGDVLYIMVAEPTLKKLLKLVL